MWVTAKWEDRKRILAIDLGQVERAEKVGDKTLFLWFRSGSTVEIQGTEQMALVWDAFQKYQESKGASGKE